MIRTFTDGLGESAGGLAAPGQLCYASAHTRAEASINMAAVFERLCNCGGDEGPEGASVCMLLESREVDSGAARYTRAMVSAALRIECQGCAVTLVPLTASGLQVARRIGEDNRLPSGFAVAFDDSDGGRWEISCPPAADSLSEDERLKAPSQLDVVRAVIGVLGEECCLYGGFAFDFISTFEEVGQASPAPHGRDFPDFALFVAQEEIVVDHVTGDVSCTVLGGDSAQELVAAFEQARDSVLRGGASDVDSPSSNAIDASVETLVAIPTVSNADFAQQVSRLQSHIHAGDIYQVVPSRGFSIPCPNAYAAYRRLRVSNPSPYLFYYRDGQREIFGSSPEAAVTVDAATRTVTIRPIAGTMPRALLDDGSIDVEEDTRRQVRLRTDAKETAEHIMLVDLARNDVARISDPGSRRVASLLTLELYSRVMHLVSQVEGRLRADLDALDAYRASMNMGTLTGAPKIRATQLIRDVEGHRRGIYGGAIGYVAGTGDFDTCIAIRCAQVCNGIASVRAGAGVVRDSVPESEAAETRHKAQAVLEAIAAAQGARLEISAGGGGACGGGCEDGGDEDGGDEDGGFGKAAKEAQ